MSSREQIDHALGMPEPGDPRHLWASGPQDRHDEEPDDDAEDEALDWDTLA